MSEQFLFKPEHIARRVKHQDGDNGIIVSIDLGARKYDQITVRWSDNDIYTYSLAGEAHNNSGVVVSLDDSEAYEQVPGPILRLLEQPVIMPSYQPAPAPETDYEETPFIPNRAEVWARFMAAAITAGITDIEKSARRVDSVVAEYEKRFLNQ